MNTPTDATELLTTDEARTLTTALCVLDAVEERLREHAWRLDPLIAFRRGQGAEACERASSELTNMLITLGVSCDSSQAEAALDAYHGEEPEPESLAVQP